MKSIFALLAAALTFVLGGKDREAALQTQIDDRDKTITGLNDNLTSLHKTLDDTTADDAAQKAALDASKAQLAQSQADTATAQKSLADLQAQVDQAAQQSDDLIAKINASTAIPVTVTPDGDVNHDTAAPSNDTRAPAASDVPTVPTDPTVAVTNDPTPAPAAS